MPDPIVDITKDSTIKDLQNEIVKLITLSQSEEKARKKSDETVDALQTEAAKLTEKLQKHVLKVEEDEKKTKELEEKLEKQKEKITELEYRVAVNSNGDPNTKTLKVSSPDYIKGFFANVKDSTKQTQKVSSELFEDEVRRWIKYKMPYADEDRIELLTKTTSAAYGPSVGYMMPADIRALTERRIYETSNVRRFATVITTETDSVTLPLFDSLLEGGDVGELTTDRPQHETPELGEVVIGLYSMYAYPAATQKSLRSPSFDVEGWITGEIVPKQFSLKENRRFVIGDGVSQARGFLSYDSWDDPEVYERDALGTYVSGSLTFDEDDLLQLLGGLLEDYQSSAIWAMHRLSWIKVLKLKDGYNRPLINPQLVFEGVQPQLYGRPVVLMGDMPKPNPSTYNYVTGQHIVAYGDFSQYIVVDSLGAMNYGIRDEYTNKGFVGWYVERYVGGGLAGFQSIKILEAGTPAP